MTLNFMKIGFKDGFLYCYDFECYENRIQRWICVYVCVSRYIYNKLRQMTMWNLRFFFF